MKLLVILVLTWALAHGVKGQSFDMDYSPLRCSGPIPKDFIAGAMEQFALDQEELEAQKAGKATNKEKKFLLSGSYAMSRLLTSGRVLFGDPLTEYCNKVMGIVLESNPGVKHNVRVYVVKSSEVNAFATDEGIIFVTVGLLSKLDNESQLAFILCHELVHHVKKHSIDIFFEKQEIDQGRGEYKRYSVEDRIMRSSIYNKEKEKEADLEGYRYFSRTPYSKAAPLEAMTLLEYAHVPFADSVFSVSFLEFGGLRFPDLYQLDSIQPVEGTADEEGETHPSISERRSYLESKVTDDTIGGSLFLVSQGEFNRVRETARFELCRLHLLDLDYGRTIYTCFLLLQQYPENKYLKVTLAKGLTGLSTYATGNDERDVLTTTSRVEGEMQRLYFLLNTLTEDGIAITAVVNNYRLVQQYKADAEVKRLYHNSVRELAENFNTLDEFARELPADFESIIDSIQPPEDKGKVKKGAFNPYEGKVVSVKTSLTRTERKEIEQQFLKYALTEPLRDEGFVDWFVDYRREIEEQEADDQLRESDYRSWLLKHKEELAEDRKAEVSGRRLGIDSLLIVSPEYIFLRPGLKSPFSISQSIEHKNVLVTQLEAYGNRCGLSATVLDASSMKSSETEEFNDLGVLNDWFDEVLERHDNRVMPGNQSEVDALSERYDVNYACWIAVIRSKDQYAGILKWLNIMGIASGPYIPYFLYKLVVPRMQYTTIALLYDLRSGEEVAVYHTTQRLRYNPGAPSAALYDLLWQIKTPKK
jgi:hypothetical protein